MCSETFLRLNYIETLKGIKNYNRIKLNTLCALKRRYQTMVSIVRNAYWDVDPLAELSSASWPSFAVLPAVAPGAVVDADVWAVVAVCRACRVGWLCQMSGHARYVVRPRSVRRPWSSLPQLWSRLWTQTCRVAFAGRAAVPSERPCQPR